MEAFGNRPIGKRGGVGIDTVRYYNAVGLLTPRTRLASGYRRYGDTELARLRFIRRAQGLGFTLKRSNNSSPLRAAGCRTRQTLGSASYWNVEARIAALNASGRTRDADCASRVTVGQRIVRSCCALTDEDEK